MTELIVSAITALGTGTMMYLLSQHDRRGWYVSLVNQLLWVTLIFVTGAWGLLPLTLWMTFVAIRGLRRWGKERDWKAEHARLHGALGSLLAIVMAPSSDVFSPDFDLDTINRECLNVLMETDDG